MQGVDDDAERLKSWLRANGMTLVYAVIAGLAVSYGYRYWRAHEDRERDNAAMLYQQTLAWYAQGNLSAAAAGVQKLKVQYSGTPYPALAELAAAAEAAGTQDLKGAGVDLRWVVAHAHDEGVRTVAEIRLADLLIDENEAAAALAVLPARIPTGFGGAVSEARGNALFAQGKGAQAASAYRAALDALPARSPDRARLTMELAQAKGAGS